LAADSPSGSLRRSGSPAVPLAAPAAAPAGPQEGGGEDSGAQQKHSQGGAQADSAAGATASPAPAADGAAGSRQQQLQDARHSQEQGAGLQQAAADAGGGVFVPGVAPLEFEMGTLIENPYAVSAMFCPADVQLVVLFGLLCLHSSWWWCGRIAWCSCVE
jgi:hypothetical protein